MTAIPLGPLALPAGPVLLFAAAALAVLLANRLAPPAGVEQASAPRPGDVLVHALLAGLAAARAAHLFLHAADYGAEPWSTLDLRDGGWHAPTGIVAGLGWIAWQGVRQGPWRKALAAGAATGLAAWAAGTLVLAALVPARLPDLTLTDLASGAPVRLPEAARGRPVVLNLWASWCGPCRHEMPVLAAAQAAHPQVLFVFANQGESAALVRRYLDAERLVLANVLLDAGSQLGPAVGSRGLPTTLFYDAGGRRVDAHLGALNGAALAARLRAATSASTRAP